MGLISCDDVFGSEVAAADGTFCASVVELDDRGVCCGQLHADQREFGPVVVGSAGRGGFGVAEPAAKLCQAD